MSTPATPAPPITPSAQADLEGALKGLAASLASQGGDAAGAEQVTEVVARVAEFLQLSPGALRADGTSLQFLLDVQVPVCAELGHVTLPIGKVLELGPGSVVELDREVSQPIDITVCGELFARGEIVVVEDRFAVRIKELLHTRGKRGPR